MFGLSKHFTIVIVIIEMLLNFYVSQMTVTWTSGYNIDEAVPFVEWSMKGETPKRSPAGTLTFKQNSMCGMIWFTCT
jgi:hypothetical protein